MHCGLVVPTPKGISSAPPEEILQEVGPDVCTKERQGRAKTATPIQSDCPGAKVPN